MSGPAQRLALAGELTIFTAQAVKQQLLEALASGGALELDLSQVDEMDSAGVQLLIAAKRAADASDQALSITSHSPKTADILDFCDLSSHFGDSVQALQESEGKAP